MQLNITGHHLEITDAIRQFVSEKFAKLEQYFDRINQVNVTLSIEKVDHIAEATVFINGESCTPRPSRKTCTPLSIS